MMSRYFRRHPACKNNQLIYLIGSNCRLPPYWMIQHLKTLSLEVLLLGICYIGDHGPQNNASSQIIRALSDSLTHGLIGGVSWSIVCNIQLNCADIMECALCVALASVVDADHFLAARSFSLKNALSLSNRPFCHATTLIFVVDFVLLFLLYTGLFKSISYKKIILMFNIAWLSHHTRDASRRGLWLYPFGATPPLSKLTYYSVIFCLPLLFRIIYVKWIRIKTDNFLTDDTFIV